MRASAVLAKVEFGTVTISESLILSYRRLLENADGKLAILTIREVCVYDAILKMDTALQKIAQV